MSDLPYSGGPRTLTPKQEAEQEIWRGFKVDAPNMQEPFFVFELMNQAGDVLATIRGNPGKWWWTVRDQKGKPRKAASLDAARSAAETALRGDVNAN